MVSTVTEPSPIELNLETRVDIKTPALKFVCYLALTALAHFVLFSKKLLTGHNKLAFDFDISS